jgi:hypothetical protein
LDLATAVVMKLVDYAALGHSVSDMGANVQKKVVGVVADSPSSRYEPLLAALAEVYPVEFCRTSLSACRGFDALLLLDGDSAMALPAAAEGQPCLVAGVSRGMELSAGSGEVRFGASTVLDDYLHNQTMVAGGSDLPAFVPAVERGDEVVASVGGKPIWLSRFCGKAACQITGTSLPLMSEKDFLFQYFNEERFLKLLPLMNFLSQLVKDTNWQSISLPACLIIDDPSLYRPSYGHLDFRRLAEHAKKHNFFVSVATIPLDAWWVHRGVAETFRSYNPRLSLVIHGNNHTAGDMLLQHDGDLCLSVAAQALRRMERLQQAHPLEVLKVMEAPHGAIANEMFPHLLALGYEAALGTTRLLTQHNPKVTWPASFGLHRSQILGGGFPVIPRIKMTPNWRNGVLIAAFLRQPVVIVLHHGDIADGYEPLIEIAGTINQLEGVTWTSPLGIARSNYTELRREDSLTIKMYSRRIQLAIPPSVKRLYLNRPWPQNGSREEVIVRNSVREIFRGSGLGMFDPVPLESAGELEIYCPPENPVDYRSVRAPGFRCWPVTRKFLMEARDRSAPWRHLVKKLLRASTTNGAEKPRSSGLWPAQSRKR